MHALIHTYSNGGSIFFRFENDYPSTKGNLTVPKYKRIANMTVHNTVPRSLQNFPFPNQRYLLSSYLTFYVFPFSGFQSSLVSQP